MYCIIIKCVYISTKLNSKCKISFYPFSTLDVFTLKEMRKNMQCISRTVVLCFKRRQPPGKMFCYAHHFNGRIQDITESLSYDLE